MKQFGGLASLCFWVVIVIACLVVIGWSQDINTLKSVWSSWTTMKPNAAVGLFLCSVSGLLLQSQVKMRRALGYLVAVAVFALALATSLEYIFHFDFKIDEFLFLDPRAQKTLWPPGTICTGDLFMSYLYFNCVSSGFFRYRLYKKSPAVFYSCREYCVVPSHCRVSHRPNIYLWRGFLYPGRHSYCYQFCTYLYGIFSDTTQRRAFGAFFWPNPSWLRWATADFLGYRYSPSDQFNKYESYRGKVLGHDFGLLFGVISNVMFFCWVAFQTANKLTEAEIERSNAVRRLEIITRAVPSVISYVDCNKHYVFANAAYESWFGLKSTEVVGKSMAEVLGSAYHVAEPYVERVLKGESIRYVNEIKMANGALRNFEADYIPDFSKANRVRGFVIIGHDITDRVRSEERLQASVKARDDLMSICSHELRTPITSMKLNNQMFKRGLQRNDPRLTSLERITKMVDQSEQQLDRLIRLIEEMIDFSRINGGKFQLHLEEFDLSQLVEETVERMRLQFEQAGIGIVAKSQIGLRGEWDRFAIEQVVVNILGNCIKYGDGKPVTVTVKQDASFAVVSVQDNGIGIAPDDQERIFKPYERAVDIRNVSGLGLGLYITSEIIRQHHGQIEVISALGQGSTFVVKLPLG